eukprot:TRINITY_DN4768_c0_g1_i1.p1 TRINITY_DN4768_c0_g1~~TRINITY_DN4768_c0_g1_i1.p1  ORF type:complete len:514 (-),score=106.70 TRINITY_DN4768_c0_g1_i1:200-1741(-)
MIGYVNGIDQHITHLKDVRSLLWHKKWIDHEAVVSTQSTGGVTAYEEIQTQSARRWGSDKKKKTNLVTYMPNVDDDFELEKDILCERVINEENDQNKKSNKHKARTITLRIYSKTKTVDELKTYVAQLIANYEQFMKDEVDKSQFYFITKIETIEEQSTLLYDQFEFVSTRSFNNIFFRQKQDMVRRLDFFLNNKEWYQKRGVPYTLGFMFYGPPGTGKTSTIKAIANYTKRHIVEISLSRIKTYKDLQKVFNETVICDKHIPHHKMIYILEDIDCLDDIVQSRDDAYGEEKKKERKKKKEKKEGEEGQASSSSSASDNEEDDAIAKHLDKAMKLEYEFFKKQMKSWQKDPLTLSHILNILDGLLECHGRILIITTNHPEKLDAALIRPGRIDMKVHFTWCSRQDTIEIIEMFYEEKVPKARAEHLIADKFTAAEVYQICFQNSDMQDAIDQLTDQVARNMLSLSSQLSQSHQHHHKKKKRALLGSNSEEEENAEKGNKKYLAKSLNLNFNHF